MKPKIQKLSNGLKILKIPFKDTKAVTVLVLLKVGSRNETADVNGVSHFIEHLMFKGTPRRPNTQVISQELDSIGAEYNAFTGKDHTGYYIKAKANKAGFCLDMLADMLFNSKFDPEEIDRERGVILEEMHMYEDSPMLLAGELLEEQMFGRHHPLGRLTIGPARVIRSISREKILAYKGRFYVPNNMAVVVAGQLERDIDRQVKRYFNNDSKKKALPALKKFRGEQKGKRIRIRYKATEQVHAALGVPGHPYGHKDLHAQILLSVIMGGNMSSRLFINIRERRGLAYFIRADNAVYEDTGAFVVQAGIDKKRIYGALEAIMAELTEVAREGVTDKELKKAKDYLAGRVALDLEDSSSVASWYGKQEILTEKLLTPEEKLRQYRRVTKGDLKRTARRLFRTNRLNLTLIGPFKDKKRFNRILRIKN